MKANYELCRKDYVNGHVLYCHQRYCEASAKVSFPRGKFFILKFAFYKVAAVIL